jgi:hypothetical protein
VLDIECTSSGDVVDVGPIHPEKNRVCEPFHDTKRGQEMPMPGMAFASRAGVFQMEILENG